jgi:alpha-beta hydrolase superfamily lysophospholipase
MVIVYGEHVKVLEKLFEKRFEERLPNQFDQNSKKHSVHHFLNTKSISRETGRHYQAPNIEYKNVSKNLLLLPSIFTSFKQVLTWAPLLMVLLSATMALPVLADNDNKSRGDDLYLEKRYKEALPYYQAVIDKLKLDSLKREQGSVSGQTGPGKAGPGKAGPVQADLAALGTAEDDLADCLCQTGDFARARSIYEAKLRALGLLDLKTAKMAKNSSSKQLPVSKRLAVSKDAKDIPPAGSRSSKDTDEEAGKKCLYLTEIAGTYFRQDNYGEAERYLSMAIPLVNEAHPAANARANLSTLLAIYRGESLYRQNRILDAVKVFQTALNGLKKSSDVSYELSKMLLGSLAGSYDQLKQFDKSVPIYRAMAILDRSYFGDTDINYGWSLLELSDALKALGEEEQASPLYEKAVWIFREENCQRLAEKYGLGERQLNDEEVDPSVSREKVAHDKKLAASLRHDVFGRGDNAERKNGDRDLQPKGAELASLFDHCQAPRRAHLGAWNVKPIKHTEAPGWVWTDPTVEQKALMLCVHGLGLHHRAFQSFAERIVGQGFTVVSFDVRGFGAYMQAKGHDHLDMNACVNDLISVIGLIKRDYAGKPVFLLGESMGGALALRVAADQPDIIDGLVCSVPAAERHAETGTKLKIGLKFLTAGNKPVDLAHTVVDKSVASSDFQERQEWLADPMARLKLSPRELIQFDHFMHQNKTFAAKICHTPVLLFQGTSDRLVKEEGTQNLFKVMPTKDKALVLLGNQEHLIFEANPYKDDVTLGIIGWLNAHTDSQNACPTKILQGARP